MDTNAAVQVAEQFVGDNSKYDQASGVRTLTQTGVMDYLQSAHQLTHETVRAVADGKKTLVSGAIEVTTKDCIAKMQEAKAAGEDPKEVSTTTRISAPDGQIKVVVKAHEVVPNPKTGEKISKPGVVGVSVRGKGLIDHDVATRTRDSIAKILGS